MLYQYLQREKCQTPQTAGGTAINSLHGARQSSLTNRTISYPHPTQLNTQPPVHYIGLSPIYIQLAPYSQLELKSFVCSWTGTDVCCMRSRESTPCELTVGRFSILYLLGIANGKSSRLHSQTSQRYKDVSLPRLLSLFIIIIINLLSISSISFITSTLSNSLQPEEQLFKMRISTFAVFLTATLAGLGVALPGEEAFERIQRSTPDAIPPNPPPRPPRPAPLWPPAPPQPDAASRHHHKRDPLRDYKFAMRSTPDANPRPAPRPRPLPPRPGPPPDRPLPPLPRPLPDSVSHRHKREADYEFDIYARESGADLKELYGRDAAEVFELYQRALGEDYMDLALREADPEFELMDLE